MKPKSHGRYDYSAITERKAIEHIVKHRERVWLTRPRDIYGLIESLPGGVG